MSRLLFLALVGSIAAVKQQYAPAATASTYSDGDDDDFEGRSSETKTAYHAAAATTTAAYHPPPAMVAAAVPYAEAQEIPHIHPSCNSGGPTEGGISAASAGYRKLGGKVAHRTLADYLEDAQRSLEEDDLEEPYDDPGCGHGVCVLAPGDHGECICDAAFMTTPDSGPCGQHQKSQGVAFLLQLFLGPFGAGAFYLGGGWIGTGVVCLLTGALAWLSLPVVCCVKGLFNEMCGNCGCQPCIPNNTNTVICCAGFLQCVMVITWFVSLIIIGTDCKVDNIPCVPM